MSPAIAGSSTANAWKRPAASMEFYPWIFAGRPQGLSAFCDWAMEAPVAPNSAWKVQTQESVHGSRPVLISVNRLANRANASTDGAYSRLQRLTGKDSYTARIDRDAAIRRNADFLARHPNDLAAALQSIRGMTTISSTAVTLQHDVREAFEFQLLPQLPSASVHLMETGDTLAHRYGMARALARADEPQQPLDEESLAFASAIGLFSDTSIGFSAYLDPLFTSFAPRVWGIAAGRPGGVVAYLFGDLIEGLDESPRETLGLYLPQRAPSVPHRFTLPDSPDYEAAFVWWVAQLNRLFAAVTDLKNSERNGLYEPSVALERLLALEQFFRTCQSIAANQRDTHARLSLLFDALDLLEGILPDRKWATLANHERVSKVLDRTRSLMPPGVASVLLPRADAALGALKRLEEGFFVKSRLANGTIRLPTRDRDEWIPLHRATTSWLRVIRNSHHGFDHEQKDQARVLLASHDGNIPPELGDLAWLHLLVIMTGPEMLLSRVAD